MAMKREKLIELVRSVKPPKGYRPTADEMISIWKNCGSYWYQAMQEAYRYGFYNGKKVAEQEQQKQQQAQNDPQT